ncbi:hypothetical protein GCM10008921_18970 [Metaclostridioides mangenotii]
MDTVWQPMILKNHKSIGIKMKSQERPNYFGVSKKGEAMFYIYKRHSPFFVVLNMYCIYKIGGKHNGK